MKQHNQLPRFGLLFNLITLLVFLQITLPRPSLASSPSSSKPPQTVAIRLQADNRLDLLTPLPESLTVEPAERTLPPGTLTIPDEPYSHVVDDFSQSWQYYFSEAFESGYSSPELPWPNLPCQRLDQSHDGKERLWGRSDLWSHEDSHVSIWPARDGADGLDPATTVYPALLDSWL